MNQMQKFKTNVQTKRKAFTIVELVIVIAVIAILAAVLVPTFSGVIDKANQSSAFQQAMAQLKNDDIEYKSHGLPGAPDGLVYEVDGYYFVSGGGTLLSITRDEAKTYKIQGIKNIIFLIPDGAGFGTYDIANAYKQKYSSLAVNGIVPGIADTPGNRQATTITTNAIDGMTVTGLYLDEFMIATADTYMDPVENNVATDSTAAATSLLCGMKTRKYMAGVNAEYEPIANLLEVSRMQGKATGFVSTKSLVDATPCSANIHVLERPNNHKNYQIDANQQYMMCGIDVFLTYGSDGGYYYNSSANEEILNNGNFKAEYYGYAIVENLETLNTVINSGAKKIFSRIFECNGEYSSYNRDYQANHIKYDIFAKPGENLTLMDMAKAALTALSANINDPDGFCLVIESGAIDNAAEGRNVEEAVAEYLAFDEVFAYCVNWAMKRGDTIVVACPDHDSGGFYADPNDSAAPKSGNSKYDTMADVIDALYNGDVENGTKLAGQSNSHTTQNVPVWLYAPELVREAILEELGIPLDTNKDKVRTGKFYDQTQPIPAYQINNSDISPAILKVLDLPSFGEVTEELFALANEYGEYESTTGIFTFYNGATVIKNTNYWTDKHGNKHYFRHGYALYLTNKDQSAPNNFYVPKSALEEIRAYTG